MSDFGSHVEVYRLDGNTPSEDDEERVRVSACSLQFSRKDHIGPYDGLDLCFGYTRDEDGSRGLFVGLTGYFVGDEEGNDGLEPEVIIAREEPFAQRFAGELGEILGPVYRCSSYSGYW